MIAFSAKVSPGLWRQLGVAYLRYVPLAAIDAAVALLLRWATESLESRLLTLIAIVVGVLLATALVVGLARKAFAEEFRLLRTILSLLPGGRRFHSD